MIDRLEILTSRVRRAFSRNRWTASKLHRSSTNPESDEPGLILVQIDGLGESVFHSALRAGHLPFLRRLMEADGYRAHGFYSGLPSSTPGVQAELFYGIPGAVPAFGYRDPILERIVS